MNASTTRFVCAFPEMLPMLIHKDVGQIPYHLARELGWTCQLVSWSRQPLEIIEPADFTRWVTHWSLGTFDSRRLRNWAFLKYLTREARRIDVLLLYHLTLDSILAAVAYKALNPKGFAILKLDVDDRVLSAFGTQASAKQRALLRLLSAAPFGLVTAETRRMTELLNPRLAPLGVTVQPFPIGVECPVVDDFDQLLAQKQNIVLTAGRLGLEQKHNELLLDALEILPSGDFADWQFWFVGSRTEALEVRLASLRVRRPDLAERIVVRDFVASRQELTEIYQRAKVYCLTSRWESFAIVLAESAYRGCYLVSTDVGVAADLTENGKYGTLVPIEDPNVLAKALTDIMTGQTPTTQATRHTHESVKKHYSWPHVVREFAKLVDVGRQAA